MQQPLVAVSTDVRAVRQLHLARRAAAISGGGADRRRRVPAAGAVVRRPARSRPPARLGRRRHGHRLEIQRASFALWRRCQRGQRSLRSGPRRHDAAADPQGDRARRAAARHLPRHPGTERGAGRHAGHRDPGARRLARPPRAGERQPGRTLRHPPDRFDQARQLPGRRVRRRRHHGQFGASPGGRPARPRGCRSRRWPRTARSRRFR